MQKIQHSGRYNLSKYFNFNLIFGNYIFFAWMAKRYTATFCDMLLKRAKNG